MIQTVAAQMFGAKPIHAPKAIQPATGDWRMMKANVWALAGKASHG